MTKCLHCNKVFDTELGLANHKLQIQLAIANAIIKVQHNKDIGINTW